MKGHRARGCFASAPLGVRAHVWTRWHSCPFPALAAHVPERGRILDLGCGHGLFALHLALTEPGRQVVGIDIDEAKLAAGAAAATACGCTDVVFLPGSAGDPPPGPWDCICVIDALYLLGPAEQEACIGTGAEQLGPGGVLVVKEMAERPRWKWAWNRAQETLAVRILRITEGGRLNFAGPDAIAGWMGDAGLAVRHIPLDRGYPHPHHLVVGTRRDGQPETTGTERSRVVA